MEEYRQKKRHLLDKFSQIYPDNIVILPQLVNIILISTNVLKFYLFPLRDLDYELELLEKYRGFVTDFEKISNIPLINDENRIDTIFLYKKMGRIAEYTLEHPRETIPLDITGYKFSPVRDPSINHVEFYIKFNDVVIHNEYMPGKLSDIDITTKNYFEKLTLSIKEVFGENFEIEWNANEHNRIVSDVDYYETWLLDNYIQKRSVLIETNTYNVVVNRERLREIFSFQELYYRIENNEFSLTFPVPLDYDTIEEYIEDVLDVSKRIAIDDAEYWKPFDDKLDINPNSIFVRNRSVALQCVRELIPVNGRVETLQIFDDKTRNEIAKILYRDFIEYTNKVYSEKLDSLTITIPLLILLLSVKNYISDSFTIDIFDTNLDYKLFQTIIRITNNLISLLGVKIRAKREENLSITFERDSKYSSLKSKWITLIYRGENIRSMPIKVDEKLTDNILLTDVNSFYKNNTRLSVERIERIYPEWRDLFKFIETNNFTEIDKNIIYYKDLLRKNYISNELALDQTETFTLIKSPSKLKKNKIEKLIILLKEIETGKFIKSTNKTNDSTDYLNKLSELSEENSLYDKQYWTNI